MNSTIKILEWALKNFINTQIAFIVVWGVHVWYLCKVGNEQIEFLVEAVYGKVVSD